MATTQKSTFSQFQSVVTILTPIIMAVGGVYGYLLQKDVSDAEAKATAAQTKLSEIETSIRNVEAMATYFRMMGGTNDAEAKMAAYALYMLNKEDPEMAVSMIMAPEKDYLMAVLIDLGSREPKIVTEVKRFLESQDDTLEATSMQKTAQKIIGQIGNSGSVAGTGRAVASDDVEGWCYLGNFATMENMRISLEDTTLPVENKLYKLDMDTNLRDDYPRKDNEYKFGDVTGVARKDNYITITKLEVDSQKRVWAKVTVTTQ